MFPITAENPMTLLKSKKPIWKNRGHPGIHTIGNQRKKDLPSYAELFNF